MVQAAGLTTFVMATNRGGDLRVLVATQLGY